MSKKPSKNKGMSSSFKASNIQTYVAGGTMGGWPPDKMLRGASLYSNAFRTNTITGDLMPTANLGFEKSFGPKKSRWTIGGDVGLPYGNQQIGNFEQGPDLASNFTVAPENNQIPSSGIGISNNPLALGFHAKYDGITNSNSGKGYVELAADYNNKTGLGVGAIGGLKFGLGNDRRRNDALRPGTAAGSITPYGGVGFGNKNNTGFIYGVQAEGEWKPKFLKKTPLSLYGKAQFQGAAGEGKSAHDTSGTQSWGNDSGTYTHPVNTDTMTFRPSASVEAGVRVPLKDLQQKMRGIDIGKLNLPALDREPREGEETEEQPYIPDEGIGWGEAGKVNASPIHKRWQPEAEDIFIDWKNQPTQGGNEIIQYPPQEEETESFAKGGHMYSGGGSTKPPKWSLGYNPYAYNAANVIGGYENFGDLTSQNLQLSTPDLFGREKNLNATRFPLSISAGRMYDKNLTNDFPVYDKITNYDGYGNYTMKTPQELLDSKETPFDNGIPLDAEISFGVEGSGLNPNMKKRSKLGAQFEVGYNPTTGVYEQVNTKQKWALGNNYANPLNRKGEWRVEPYIAPLNFQFAQKPAVGGNRNEEYEKYLQGLVTSGSPYDPTDPNNPLQAINYKSLEGKKFVSTGAGVDAQVKLPLGMLDAGIGASYNWQQGQGQKFSPTAHLGYKIGLDELGNKINLPEINSPERSPFRSMSAAGASGTRYDNSLFEEEPAPQESMGKVNASPINKQLQEEIPDIYLPFEGATPGAAKMTYDPSMGKFENNTEAMNNYSKGGGIHINPANKGKFTASANAADMGVQEFASHVLANKGSYTPLQIQRANFAHNAAGWQHAEGGFNNRGFQSLPPEVQAKIRSNSFADGGQLTEFNEGGTHAESPLGGIPQGMAPDGKMNLVEEGETKLNAADYIFSDQIKVDKETATLFGLPKGDVGKTFADVSKKVNRPNSRRDNDTIEQVAIQRDLENLMQAQEKQKEIQKDKDIAEFASKYPDLAQNMPVPGQEQQMMQPPMDPNAMQQGMMQEQMNPPAGLPQQPVDPAMMAQMQQMGQMPRSYGGSLFNCGGKMYNAGGYMYAGGGNVMRGIGAGAYGVGEGLLDTLTFGLTDSLTDKGFDKLAGMGGRSESEVEKDKMIRGFGNVGGAVLGAGLTGGATTSSALNEGIEGLTSGVTNIKGTDEKFDKIAGGIGQGASMVAGFMGPEGATQAAGVFKGNEAVNKLMAAKQNPFINQATQFASKAFANGGHMNYSMYQPFDHVTQYGGPLNMPTNDNPYANFLAGGGNMEGENPENPNKPTLAFNLNGIVANYTLEQAINDPLVLEAFGASADEKGQFSPEDVEAAKLAIEQKFIEESPANRQAAFLAQQEYDAALSEDAAGSSMDRLPGETDAAYQSRMASLNTKQDAKPGVGEIKQTPLEGVMMALPAAYNIGRGIFGKPNLLNYDDYAQKANIDPYTMNIDPQLAEVRRAYAGANQAIKNASPGSGAYLANMANVAASKQEATNALYTKKEMFDKEAKYKTDMANREINNSNLDLKMKLQTYNDAAKAAKAKSLQEGLGQLADIAQNEQGISLQEALLKLTSPDYAEKFNYSSLFEQAQKAAKAKKGTKAEK